MPCCRQASKTVGNRSGNDSPPPRESRAARGDPRRRRPDGRATTSRGSSSPWGATSASRRRPSPSTSTAPAPRSASVRRGMGSAPTSRAVGWNCTNSRSARRAPTRQASARPSPVASGGLVVRAKTWPMPPVASTTARARCSTESAVGVPGRGRRRRGPRPARVEARRPARRWRAAPLGEGRAQGATTSAPVASRHAARGRGSGPPHGRGPAGRKGPGRSARRGRGGVRAAPAPPWSDARRRRRAELPRHREGVRRVERRRVAGAHRPRDPALGPRTVAGSSEGALGEQVHAAPAEAERHREPGRAGAKHDDVGLADRVEPRGHRSAPRPTTSILSTARRARTTTASSTSTGCCIVWSAFRIFGRVILFMWGQRLQGRTDSVSGNRTATLSAIEHSVTRTTRDGRATSR